ncbi:uncharacterized protein [Arachis hypogaea]|uniref:uncharacterized protein n=1 Tax=Arachis hypogaea TaxID=3818 RepID=UPI000DEC2955|nr:LOB domain-containing protein 22-like [Arachis hypogaea]
MSSSNFTITTRTGNSTTQACAACKYQRRKCAPDCILAPYFPHDRQRQFLNAHKLFGVSNITKIIKVLNPHEKDEAMKTIIFQSDMRAKDPVGGCYRMVQDLQAQIEFHLSELELVLQQLAILRAQAQHQQAQHLYNQTATSNINVSVNGDDSINSDPLTLYSSGGSGGLVVGGNGVNHYHYLQQMPHHDQYMMVQEVNDSSSNNGTPLQEHANMWSMQNSLSSLSLQGQNSNCSVGDEYDHKPMLDMASDDRNELGFEPQDLVQRSDEAVLFKIDDAVIKAETDCFQQVQDHDLKGAATLFTLTNCTS